MINVNIADLLRYAPNGTELYSLKLGSCKLIEVTDDYESIKVEYIDNNSEKKTFSFDSYGRIPYNGDVEYNLYLGNDNSLKWEDLRKPKEDLQPFDPVLVRKSESNVWQIDLFGVYMKNYSMPFFCMAGIYEQCIKYNEGLKYLLGRNIHMDVWKNIFED